MSTEVVDVLSSWTIQSTSETSINHLSLPVSTSSKTNAPASDTSTTALATDQQIKSSNTFSDNENTHEEESSHGEAENELDDFQHMTPRSPTTSLTSLPPLPDLIPIRKSNLNHPISSNSNSIITKLTSPTSSTSTLSSTFVANTISSPENSCTNECLTDGIHNDSSNLSSHTLDNCSSPTKSPIEHYDDASKDGHPQQQHSNEVDHEIESKSDNNHEEQTEYDLNLSELNIGEKNSSSANEEDISMRMTPIAITTKDNHQSTDVSHPKSSQKKRSRLKTGSKRTSENSEIVQHRKSDRRRVARDIFFLFEQHPSNRRRGKKGKKRGPGRPKIKKSDAVNPAKSFPQTETLSTTSTITAATTTTTTVVANQDGANDQQPPGTPVSDVSAPRVNPIFVFVKQDDTKIVEVRCEDYDKRNRIRLTKTPNGWRAIPRTDTSSSRVAKLVPNPCVRVKQELQVRGDLLENSSTKSDVVEDIVRRMKKSKKKKKKKKKRKHVSEPEDDSDDDVRKLLSSSPKDVIVYESTNHDRDGEHDPPMQTTPPTLAPLQMTPEPNNNEMSADLSKNLTQISDDIELDMPFMHHLQNENSMMSLCPQTGVFQSVNQSNATIPASNNDHHVLTSGFDSSEVCHDVATKHLKDLLDSADLLQHCDNAMSGAELLDSLVKRGCEDNHISEDEGNSHQNHLHNPPNVSSNGHSKNAICLTNDFENEDDDILMQPEPVEDIISRLGESLATSPKCLSFNEAGEIEGLHGELFQTTTQPDPFNRTTLEELSITIKDLEKSSETFTQAQRDVCNTNSRTIECTTTIVSPDSCVDELPKDLTCKKDNENALKVQPLQSQPQLERSNSRSSDAIQSPQPSGLPAVPPSPDLMHSKNKSMFLDQLLSANSISPKVCSSVSVTPVKVTKASPQQQKEPLDLGKHRKSASPTVSCSEEAKRTNTITPVGGNVSSGEPLHKKIKTEPEPGKQQMNTLIQMLSSGDDPDPLTQLRLLVSNPEWKVPDPILVPKDRLSAVLASPAREIPLLLTTRPELRLPDAFAYPSILQDPDILVISMAQLESILQKQMEISKPKASPIPQITIEAVSKKRSEKITTPQPDSSPMKKNSGKSLLNPMAPLLASGMAGDIDAATLAAFNQMLWLPYLGQMAPELFKAMAGLPNSANLTEMLPFLIQQQQQQQQQQQHQSQQSQAQRQQFSAQFNPSAVPNPMAFQNPLEFAMLQEAFNQAQMQRALKVGAANQHREQYKKTPESKMSAARSNYNMGSFFAQKGIENVRLQQQQPQHQQQQGKGRNMSGLNTFRQEQNRGAMRQNSTEKGHSMRQLNPFYVPHTGLEISPVRKSKQTTPTPPFAASHQEQKPRVTCKSLSNLLQPERLMQESKMSNLMAMPQFDFNQLHLHHQQQQHQGQLSQAVQSQQQGSHQSQYSNALNLPNSGGNTNQTSTSSSASSTSGQSVGKLKVKPAPHLLDPAAMQRRLLNYDEIPEVGSTTNSLDDLMNDPNAHLWHPLFGSTQKTGYTSPWQWTTVTATGE